MKGDLIFLSQTQIYRFIAHYQVLNTTPRLLKNALLTKLALNIIIYK